MSSRAVVSPILVSTFIVVATVLTSCEPSSAPGPSPGEAKTPATPAPKGASWSPPENAAANVGGLAPSQAGAPTSATNARPPATGPEGMKQLPSGALYTTLKEGSGQPPAPGSMVTLHLTGWLQDGKIFTDTRPLDTTKKYRLDRKELVDGLVDVLSIMKPGEKCKAHLPAKLAYGSTGYPGVVPPNSDLIFEIELVAVAPPGSR